MLNIIRRVVAGCAAMLVLSLTFIVALQVFQRFVIGRSLVWPDETAALLLAWITFIGAYLTSADDDHVRFRLVHDRFPRPLAAIILTLGDLAVCGFLFILTYYSITIVERTWDQTPITVPISKGFIYLVMPVMSALMIVETIAHNFLVRRLVEGYWPSDNDAEDRRAGG